VKRNLSKPAVQARRDNSMDSEQTAVNVEQIVGLLRRRAPWILLSFVLVSVGAFAFSKTQTKKYTATASLVFNNQQLSQQTAGLQPVSTSNQQSLQNTNLKLVQLGDMAAKTAQQLDHGLTEGQVRSSLSVSAQGESNIVNVSATSTVPALAAAIANTYASQFVAEQQDTNHQYYATALALVNKQLSALGPRERVSSAGIALENRAQSLGVLAELRSGNVAVAQPATVPTTPSSPKTGRNTILGAVLGLLLGLAVAFLIERLDRRIREPKDLEALYGLPLLGVVPESSALARSQRRNGKAAKTGSANGTGSLDLPAADAEAFQLIRAHLRYFNVDRHVRTLLIASAAPGDGKTTVARHLAAAAARMGSRTLLIEADLRRPTLAERLGVHFGPGLADVLIGASGMHEAIQSLDLGRALPHRADDRKSLDVLVAGVVLPPNPAALIESHAMESLLEAAKSTYDLVVIDTPPLTAVSDAFPLLRKVDGVVIVGWVGRNRRDVAQRLHETLAGAGAALLGVVANGVKLGRFGGYGYGYGYGYAQDASRDTAAGNNGALARDGIAVADGVPSGTNGSTASDGVRSPTAATFANGAPGVDDPVPDAPGVPVGVSAPGGGAATTVD
jgi:capsular exopolysaccharide synthesis family protein